MLQSTTFLNVLKMFKSKPNWEDPSNYSLSDLSANQQEDYPLLFTGLPKPIAFSLLALAMAGKMVKDTIFPSKIGSFFEKSPKESHYVQSNDDYPIEI